MILSPEQLEELVNRELNLMRQRPRSQEPVLLLPRDQLRALPRVPEYEGYHSSISGIYFLWAFGVLLYIGKSIDIPYRVWNQHVREKHFTHATWLSIAGGDKENQRYEVAYVLRYRPPLNRTSYG